MTSKFIKSNDPAHVTFNVLAQDLLERCIKAGWIVPAGFDKDGNPLFDMTEAGKLKAKEIMARNERKS